MASETKDELVAKAAELGITVARHDGQEGEPTVNDYKAAISAHEAATAAGVEGVKPAGESKTFKVTGALPVFGMRTGQTFDATVSEHEVTGDAIALVGSEWALLGPLLEQGMIEEVN